jgi:hypothetical protein
MKKLLFAFFISAFVSVSALAQESRSITVVGEASTTVEPDEITLRFAVKEEMSFDEEVEPKSLDDLEAGIKKFLKEKGIKESALSPAPPQTIMGMAMTKKNARNYSLKLSDASLIKEVMTNLPVLGASSMQITSLKSNKEKELKLKMQKEALIEAKKKAENLLSVFDEKVGKVIEISEKSTSPFGEMFNSGPMEKFYNAIFSKLMPTQEEEDYSVKIEYSVTVKFAIK